MLATILSEQYQVDMLIYTKTETGRSVTSTVFNIINVPINLTRSDSTQTLAEQMRKFRFSEEYRNVGIYKVNIKNHYEMGILDYLRRQNYIFGIAEFEIMAGSFAVFHALGIEKTFNVAATVFFPKYLQLLEIDEVPVDVTKHKVPG
uniref:Glucuronosyltransferase n=1 Tax=Meloidogyne javanica TaxID=6303 RepID=A0A915NA63_MELJA